MSDKPTTVADWTPTGADVVTPSAGEKTAGWQGGDRLPAQHVNWFWELITQWVIWLNNGIYQRSSLTDNTPLVQTCDRDGRPRHYLDASGYWMGPAIQEQFRWGPVDSTTIVSGNSPGLGALTYIENDCTIDVVPGDLGAVPTGAPQLEMAATGANGDSCAVFPTVSNTVGVTMSAGECIIGNLDNVVAVCEWSSSFSTTTMTNSTLMGGFHSLDTMFYNVFAVPTSNSYAMFYISNASGGTFWCTSSDGTNSQDDDSGITMVADTLYNFRIEHHGKNTPVGVGNSTAGVTRYFIDGVKVHEETGTGFMSGGNMSPFQGITSFGTSPVMSVTSMKYAFNDTLDFDVPA